jgi:hypothetical protein
MGTLMLGRLLRQTCLALSFILTDQANDEPSDSGYAKQSDERQNHNVPEMLIHALQPPRFIYGQYGQKSLPIFFPLNGLGYTANI